MRCEAVLGAEGKGGHIRETVTSGSSTKLSSNQTLQNASSPEGGDYGCNLVSESYLNGVGYYGVGWRMHSETVMMSCQAHCMYYRSTTNSLRTLYLWGTPAHEAPCPPQPPRACHWGTEISSPIPTPPSCRLDMADRTADGDSPRAITCWLCFLHAFWAFGLICSLT